MKKKLFLTVLAIVCVCFAAFAYGKFVKTKVSDGDGCSGCTITEISYKCGKCKHPMESHYLATDSRKSTKQKYRFDCTNCSHSSIYWIER